MTKSRLISFIQEEEIAYQLADGLLSFSSIDKDPLIDMIQKSTAFTLVRRDEILDSRFTDLAEWSIEGDHLFLSDNGLLICLSENLMNRYMAVA